jgi:hypothetical protein
MSGERDPIRDALKSIADQFQQPNPLEVLGVNRELAAALQPEALELAVKGLYRAHQSQLHPDRVGSNPALAEKQQAIQAAYEQVTSEGVAGLRERMLAKKPRKGSATTTSERLAAQLRDRDKSAKERADISSHKASDYIDSLLSDESIRRIKRGFALLRPTSPLKQDQRLSMLGLGIDGAHVWLDELTIEQDTPVPRDLAIPKDQLQTNVYVQTDRALVRDTDGRLVWQSTNLPDGWHQIRGIGDKRSMQSLYLPRRREVFPFELAGCLPEDTALKLLEEYYKQGSDWKSEKRAELDNAPTDASLPKRFRNRFLIPDGWRQYTVGGEEVEGQLTPKLVPGEVLTARSGTSDLMVLGRVEEAYAHYMGK